jgi:broad specificity phosphatase PhoE
MELIIIRHGETEENSRGVIHGHSKGKLSSRGQQQAKDLAVKLKGEQITAIYSSDYQRCIQTAEILHAKHKDIPLKFIPEIREIHGGSLNKVGFSPKLVIKGIQLMKLLHLKSPGGESWDELCARVGNFLNETYDKHKDETIVLVTHGIAMQAMRSLLEDNRGHRFQLQEVPNCTMWK